MIGIYVMVGISIVSFVLWCCVRVGAKFDKSRSIDQRKCSDLKREEDSE